MDAGSLRIACSSCNLRELCMPIGIGVSDMQRLDEVVANRRKISAGDNLFNSGEPFRSLFAIRSGFFKTRISSEDGREQVTGFQMAGEIMGLDGIVTETHNCDAVALEDSEVCVMPFDRLESLCREVPVLQRHMNKVMSREIVRENQIMLLLGAMRAEERIAAFILNLVQRLDLRGYSKSEIILRMSREEIGSYLGMKIETVSRTFTKLCDQSILETKHRYVKILDLDKLKALLR